MRKNTDRLNSDKKSNDLMKNLFSQLPEFIFNGNKEVVIEGSKGVVEYSEELIRINTSVGMVCFSGRNLNLKCISVSSLIINGFIVKVEFVV